MDKSLEDVLRAINSLQTDERFSLIKDFLKEMLEANRNDLEEAKEGFRLVQGKVMALREVLTYLDGADELLRKLKTAGESGIDPAQGGF